MCNRNRVTEEDVKRNMQDVLVRTEVEFGKPVTYVTVRMENGFTVRESTTCVDPSNYNEEVGKEICLKKIKDSIYLLLGYQLQSIMYSGQTIRAEDIDEKPMLHIANDVIVTAMDGVHLAFSNENHLYQVDEDGELHISIAPQCKQNFHHEFNLHAVIDAIGLETPYTYAAMSGITLAFFKPMKDNKALFFCDGVIEIIDDFKEWAGHLDMDYVFEVTSAD